MKTHEIYDPPAEAESRAAETDVVTDPESGEARMPDVDDGREAETDDDPFGDTVGGPDDTDAPVVDADRDTPGLDADASVADGEAAGADEATAVDAGPDTVADADADADAPMLPGQAAGEALWPQDTVTGLRQRWQHVQLRFVDSPSDAVTEADGLVREAADMLVSLLGDSRDGDAGRDTEQLRQAMLARQRLLDRLLTI